MTTSKLQQRLEMERRRDAYLRRLLTNTRHPRRAFSDEWSGTEFEHLHRKSVAVLDERAHEHLRTLHRMVRRRECVREIGDWRPRGRGWLAVVRSLYRHLLCQYSVPSTWDVVWDQKDSAGRDCYLQLARGASLRALVRDGVLGASLTRRGCHLLSRIPRERTLAAAIRMAQVLAQGGTRRLGRALADSEWGGQIVGRWHEVQRAELIAWIVRSGMNPVDAQRLARAVSLRPGVGRRILRRGAEGAMQIVAEVEVEFGPMPRPRTNLPPGAGPAPEPVRKWASSGLPPFREGPVAIIELTTRRELVSEGAAMRHCVATYADYAVKRELSIWSLRLHRQRVLTLEVDHREQSLVQARGCGNRDPDESEMVYVRRWAAEAGLVLDLF